MEDEEARKKEFFARKAEEEGRQNFRPQSNMAMGRSDYEHGDGSKMKIVTLVVAIAALILALILGGWMIDVSSKLSNVMEAQGSGKSELSTTVEKARAALDNLNDKTRDLQQSVDQLKQNYAQTSNTAQQNAAAITDMKSRINRIIDLMK